MLKMSGYVVHGLYRGFKKMSRLLGTINYITVVNLVPRSLTGTFFEHVEVESFVVKYNHYCCIYLIVKLNS
jgi:hypothetical protein